MTQEEFVEYVSRQVQHEGSAHKAAGVWGISTQYLRDVLMHRRAPGPKIVAAVGYTVVTTKVYRRRNETKDRESNYPLIRRRGRRLPV